MRLYKDRSGLLLFRILSLAGFIGADRVDLGKVVSGRLRQPLARALREAGAVVTPK